VLCWPWTSPSKTLKAGSNKQVCIGMLASGYANYSVPPQKPGCSYTVLDHARGCLPCVQNGRSPGSSAHHGWDMVLRHMAHLRSHITRSTGLHGRQMERQAGRRTDRQTDRETYRHTDIQTDRPTYRQTTDRHIGSWTDRQTDRHACS
jgi:hypothetical protein